MPNVPREKQLQSHLDVLRKVAGGIAHQSKSPLNSIAINAFILREKLSQISAQNKEGERLFVCLTSIESDVRRLDSMLDMFFHFVRDDGKAESYNVSALIQECFDLLYHLATKYNCTLSVSSEQEVDSHSSKARVRQVIVSTLLALLPTNSDLSLELRGSREKFSVSVVARTADPANPLADPFLQLASGITSELQGEFRTSVADNGGCRFEIVFPAVSEKTSGA